MGLAFRRPALRGENNTYGGEGVLSGIYNKASFSLGGFHFQTHGFRKNANQTMTLVTPLLQFELSPQTSIQGEYRYRNLVKRRYSTEITSQVMFFPTRQTEKRRRPHAWVYGMHFLQILSFSAHLSIKMQILAQKKTRFLRRHSSLSSTQRGLKVLLAPSFNTCFVHNILTSLAV